MIEQIYIHIINYITFYRKSRPFDMAGIALSALINRKKNVLENIMNFHSENSMISYNKITIINIWNE